ncbi:MAG: EamA family transporter [Candidatus Cloacimonetes bacterium]|nr:EamA family transporter [Candidatus Cloacimonadota bacterium]MBT6994815.1 EamA family transporter [Candidatus Cloacimonadota bacterium]MBT7470187.1 EamA family transporter [Candidatus Cloacimonadota bacterium]
MKHYFFIFAAIIFWGISFISTRILLNNDFSPNIITFLRFAIAAILFHFFQKRKQQIEKKDKKYFIIMAISGVSMFYFFENSAVKYTTIANTTLAIATVPLFMLLTAHFIFKKKLCWQNFIGIPLGLFGTFLLFRQDILTNGVHLKGDLLAFGASFLWVIYSFAFKKVMEKYDTLFITAKIIFYGVIFLIPIILFEYKSFFIIKLNLISIVHLVFLAVFCSFLAYLFWNIATKKIGVKITSNFILIIPILSIIFSHFFLNESFSENIILASILIISGAYLTSISDKNNKF